MAISIKRLEGIELPTEAGLRGLNLMFLVTSWDGKKYYLDGFESAAAFAVALHLEDRSQNGDSSSDQSPSTPEGGGNVA
jgi:hypothetical protein